MNAIKVINTGPNSQLQWCHETMTHPEPHEVRIKIRATAVNRADLLQRRGRYPPPEGSTDILGLECAGVIDQAGSDVRNWRTGDRVMVLLAGGGYAEEVNVHANLLMPIPSHLSFEEAAAIPEAFMTAFLNLFVLGQLRPTERCLIHSGGSGVGTAAIQLAKVRGSGVIITAGSDEKLRRCTELGADAGLNYHKSTFSKELMSLGNEHPIDVILDTVGARFTAENIGLLANGGRLLLIGLLGGSKSEVDLGAVLTKNLTIMGSTLRNKSLEEKMDLTMRFKLEILPLFETKKIRPVVDRILPVTDADKAHAIMYENRNFGKIVLRIP